MEISHVIRGEDHISNTPKQIWLYQAFGWTVPQFAHLPLILNEDRTKLSKRKNKVSVNDYLKEGYLPEALINFLALLGWNTADEQEIFSMEELIEKFDLDRVQKAGAVFDLKRLQWINGMYIRQLSREDLLQRVLPYWREMPWFDTKASTEFLMNIIKLLQDRLTTLSDITLYTQYFFALPVYEKELLIGKKMDAEMAKTAITKTIELLQTTDDFSEEHLKEILIELRDRLGFNTGQLLWPVRAALSGEPASPGAFELLSVFGKEESLRRLSVGLAKL
jgi:glutamyl-tRNA synthetase